MATFTLPAVHRVAAIVATALLLASCALDADVSEPPSAADAQPAMPLPDGGYRLSYMRNGEFGRFQYSTSADGRVWSAASDLIRTTDGFNTSVARDPDGVWWLYFNRSEDGCLE